MAVEGFINKGVLLRTPLNPHALSLNKATEIALHIHKVYYGFAFSFHGFGVSRCPKNVQTRIFIISSENIIHQM